MKLSYVYILINTHKINILGIPIDFGNELGLEHVHGLRCVVEADILQLGLGLFVIQLALVSREGLI